MKEEILSTCVTKLKTKVDTIMLDINGLLSKEYEEGVSEKISVLIVELALADQALRQASSLVAQAMAQRLSAIAAQAVKESTTEEGGGGEV